MLPVVQCFANFIYEIPHAQQSRPKESKRKVLPNGSFERTYFRLARITQEKYFKFYHSWRVSDNKRNQLIPLSPDHSYDKTTLWNPISTFFCYSAMLSTSVRFWQPLWDLILIFAKSTEILLVRYVQRYQVFCIRRKGWHQQHTDMHHLKSHFDSLLKGHPLLFLERCLFFSFLS